MKNIRLIHSKVIVSIIGVLLFTATAVPARADNLQQQLHQSQQQVNQLKGTLNAQKNKVSTATTQVLTLKQSVQALNNSIARDQVLLTDEQHHLQELEDQQQKLEVERQEHIKALGKFLKSNYEDGASTYLAVLLDATSLPDFIERADKIQMIVGTYGKLQKEIIALNETMNTQKESINQKKASIQVALQDKEQTQQAVQQALDKQKAVLAQLSANEKATVNASLSAQANVSRIKKLIEQEALEAAYAKNSANSATSSPAGSGGGVAGTVKVSGGAKQILSFAAKFLGTPYVWGGTSPSPGFDCSGYVQYVYRQAGISLNRTSEQQFNNGVSVSRSELRAGDLVFFHTYSSGASHVGIYVGNNTMINSSNGGVSYDDMTNSYWKARYLGARRVIAP
ncbi:NlpC/P60 family protein [Desulfosporosinus sp. BG]|uniref:C40 family peptidase n=1 Tax=Desulfosporosinus sp. BG TaxID=1633135 RepID=UPI00083B51F7|nr:NlpC/P60 family protein [Desulfosporosinus sp. BG]ODA40747.1 NLP/P60 family protein [Desulfosporosinus sp. BG]